MAGSAVEVMGVEAAAMGDIARERESLHRIPVDRVQQSGFPPAAPLGPTFGNSHFRR